MGNASLKRWVLSEALNTARVGAALICCGSGFQRVGADTEKALSPQVHFLVFMGKSSRLASPDLREREGAWRLRRSER